MTDGSRVEKNYRVLPRASKLSTAGKPRMAVFIFRAVSQARI